MKIPDKWWSYPAESESGNTLIVTGHDGLDEVMRNGRYKYRVDVSWDYRPKADGMPVDSDAEMMERVTDAFAATLDKDQAAVMTGIYTGDGRRDWIFYTLSLHIFQKIINRALDELPLLPLEIDASEDPDWSEYREMRESTYIPDEE